MVASDTDPTKSGNAVLRLVKNERKRLIIVAPFIKTDALERILRELDSSVVLRVLTRWLPEEVLAGVTDIGIWPIVHERGGELGHLGTLHAKAYVGSEQLLIGSANVTMAGLGWSAKWNDELLVRPTPEDGGPIREAVEALWDRSQVITKADFETCVAAIGAADREDWKRPLLPKSATDWPFKNTQTTDTTVQATEVIDDGRIDGGDERVRFLVAVRDRLSEALQDFGFEWHPGTGDRYHRPTPLGITNSRFALRAQRVHDDLDIVVRAMAARSGLWVAAESVSLNDIDSLRAVAHETLNVDGGRWYKGGAKGDTRIAAWRWREQGFETAPDDAAVAVLQFVDGVIDLLGR